MVLCDVVGGRVVVGEVAGWSVVGGGWWWVCDVVYGLATSTLFWTVGIIYPHIPAPCRFAHSA